VDGARQQAVAATWFELGSVLILAAVVFVSIRLLRLPPASILILLLVFARVMPRSMSAPTTTTVLSSTRFHRSPI